MGTLYRSLGLRKLGGVLCIVMYNANEEGASQEPTVAVRHNEVKQQTANIMQRPYLTTNGDQEVMGKSRENVLLSRKKMQQPNTVFRDSATRREPRTSFSDQGIAMKVHPSQKVVHHKLLNR